MDISNYTLEYLERDDVWGAEELLNEVAREVGFELAPHVAPVVARSFDCARQDLGWDGEQALERIGDLEALRRELDQALLQQVWLCRMYYSHSWADIGAKLHISRQATEHRYKNKDQIEDPDMRAYYEARAGVIEAEMKLLRAQARREESNGMDSAAPGSKSSLSRQLSARLFNMAMLESERLAEVVNERHRRQQETDEVESDLMEPHMSGKSLVRDEIGGES